jgi:hypothetical protein
MGAPPISLMGAELLAALDRTAQAAYQARHSAGA